MEAINNYEYNKTIQSKQKKSMEGYNYYSLYNYLNTNVEFLFKKTNRKRTDK